MKKHIGIMMIICLLLIEKIVLPVFIGILILSLSKDNFMYDFLAATSAFIFPMVLVDKVINFIKYKNFTGSN